jgi:hypothetical protein
MKWVTRRGIRVNRAATAWLVRRFIDPDATFAFVAPEDVGDFQAREGAIGFDAPGATYPHADALGRCSFESLVAEYRPNDGALAAMAAIVHDADFPDAIQTTAEAAGLRAVSRGLALVAGDDAIMLERASLVYDGLYAHLAKEQRPVR